MNMYISSGLTTAACLAVLIVMDSYRRGNGTGKLIFFFGGGLLAILPVLILYRIIPSPDMSTWNLYDLLGKTALFGPLQEISKFILFYTISRRLGIREPMDAALQAAAVGLGFSLISLGSAATIPGGTLSIAAHVLFAGIWGYGFAVHRRRVFFFLLVFFPIALAQGLFGFLLDLDLLLVALYLTLALSALSIIIYRSKFYHSAPPILTIDPMETPKTTGKPSAPYRLLTRAALSSVHRGDYQRALVYIDRSLILKPHNTYLKALQGIILMLCGHLDQGEALLQKSRKKLTAEQWWNLRRTIRRLVEGRSETVNRAVRYNLFFVDQALRFTDLDAYARLTA